jgi:hypothetical protein
LNYLNIADLGFGKNGKNGKIGKIGYGSDVFF